MNTEFGPKKPGVPRVIHVTTIGITSHRALLAQCRYFRQQGCEVGFVFSPSPEGDMLRRLGFPVREIYIDRKIKPWADAGSTRRLRSYFRVAQPDIIHTHTSKAGVVGRVAARLAGVPGIMHTVHGFPFYPGMFWPKRVFFQQIERQLGRFTTALFSQSGEDVATAARIGIRAVRGGLIHIGNGVDLAEFNPAKYSSPGRLALREKLGLGTKDPVVATIGRINREKGYHDLVEALGRIREQPWQAVFIGADEGYLAQLRRQIEAGGLRQRIHLLGLRQDITDLLAVSDVYVLPSYREGLPRSLIEAQAMALPCVATDIRGCREVIHRDVTGFLVPPGDVTALAAALGKLLSDDRLRLRMGGEGRRRSCEHFDETDVGRRVMAVYGDVLGNEKNTGYNQQL